MGDLRSDGMIPATNAHGFEDDMCKHCGGPKEIRNPTGECDHLYWPDMLTDEAKRANGYKQVRKTVTTWEK